MRVQEMFYLVNRALESWVDPIFNERKNRSGEISAYYCKNASALVVLLEPLKPFPGIKQLLAHVPQLVSISRKI